MSNPVYIRKFGAWAPGVETPEEWAEWKSGKREILREALTPKLPFVDMLLRRRLSMVTKMAVYVNHIVSEGLPLVKITFSSEYGEIRQQFKISQKLIELNTVTPANFSLSVFNAPVSCSTIVEGNMSGYSASYSGANSFEFGLRDCVNGMLCEGDSERVFVFSDELIPGAYSTISDYPNVPFALALRLSSEKRDGDVELDLSDFPKAKHAADQALEFFKERVLK